MLYSPLKQASECHKDKTLSAKHVGAGKWAHRTSKIDLRAPAGIPAGSSTDEVYAVQFAMV